MNKPAPSCFRCERNEHEQCGGRESGCGCAATNHGNEATDHELKLADELILEFRRHGVDDLEPYMAVLRGLEESHRVLGTGVALVAGIWYYTRILQARQRGETLNAENVDRTCMNLARLMTGDKVL